MHEQERPKRGRMRERRYESSGFEVLLREGDDNVGLELDGIPIEVACRDAAYHAQIANALRSFPTIDAVGDDLISEVRPNLDAFSEIAVLENHRYLLAEAAVKTHLPELVYRRAEVHIPHPDWMDAARG